MSMSFIGDISSVSDRESAGSQLADKLWLVHVDSQLDESVPFPKPNPDRELGTIPLKPGEVMHYFTVIPDSLSDTSTAEKGDITTNVTNTISFVMGGNRDQLLNFMEKFSGGRFLLISQTCSSKEYYLHGTPCKPMVLKSHERKNDKESRSISFTFESKGFDQPFKYKGDIVRASPATIAVGSDTLAVKPDKSVYNTPAVNSSAKELAYVSGVGSADRGRTIDIVGTGGEFPLEIPNGDSFILIDKQTWRGTAGSRISFKVLDSTVLVEVEGSRVQTA